MNKIAKWSILCLFFIILSCNKDKQYQTSTWMVNNDTFSANNYSIGIEKLSAGFSCSDLYNRFALGFYLPYLPTTGEWPVYIKQGQEPSNAGITFYYNEVYYIVSPYENAYLIASEKNQKASYHLNQPGM